MQPMIFAVGLQLALLVFVILGGILSRGSDLNWLGIALALLVGALFTAGLAIMLDRIIKLQTAIVKLLQAQNRETTRAAPAQKRSLQR
ncbi:MAG: hypothetical protein IPM16_19475 [Chloroflexi bacterium]|nr:hypothetical protein [Chloroflexota bacterium]